MNPNPNDPSVIALSKAIFQHESGGDFNAVGDAGTSHGAGQWQPATWKAQAKTILGDENAPMTPENQKAVIQGSIAIDKANGLNPAQIAAKWNSGSPDGWENKIGKTTINGQQISYNVPAYVKSVTDLYQQYKNGSAPATTGTSQVQPTQQPQQSFGQEVGSQLSNRLGQANSALNDTVTGKINPLSGIIRGAGALGGVVGDVTGDALGAITPDFIKKPLEGLAQKAGGAIANSSLGQSAIQGAQGFEQDHPEIAGDISAGADALNLIPAFKGAGIAKDIIGAGVGKALGKDALSSIVDDVTPTLTGKSLDKKIAKGGLTKSGILGTIQQQTTPQTKNIAQAVSQAVPNFSKLGTFTDKINAVRQAAFIEGDQLKQQIEQSGKNIIFPQKELAATLKNIDLPFAIKSDTTLTNQFDLARSAAMKLAQENGGNLSGLLQTRKDFDRLVEKQFPNLYDRTNAPMRDAIQGIRDSMNNFLEEKLPAGSGYKESLKKQSLLLKAATNMASKARQEVGSNGLSRFAGRHPLLKGIGSKVLTGALGGLGFGETQKLLQ